MSNLQIPSVTIVSFHSLTWHRLTILQEDLQAFQAKHFPSQIQHTPTFENTVDEPEFAEDYDDLGYYPDGVKRTLTDEQIRMFRHSEVHSLLRERELQEENEAADGSNDERLNEDHKKRDGTKADNNTKTTVSNPSRSKDHGLEKEKSAQANNASTESGMLDYGDDDVGHNNQQTKGAAGSTFSGRKIISYADD